MKLSLSEWYSHLDKIGMKRCEICNEGLLLKGKRCTQWLSCINTPHITGQWYIDQELQDRNTRDNQSGIGISEIME